MCPPKTDGRSSPRSPLTRSKSSAEALDAKDASTAPVDLKTLEPHELAATFETRWVRVEDVEYDVTNFKHPGGSVIFYMLANTGADATEAFKEFHMRSLKAWKMLRALPSRPAEIKRSESEDAPMLEDFARWRAELERDGFFKPSITHVAYRLLELLATFALGTALMYAGYPIIASVVYGAFFGARCGWVQHEGGHNSLTGSVYVDKRLQAMTCGFGLSTSGEMWNQMHNKHHATPQKVRHDMDLDTTPAVAFFKHRRGGQPAEGVLPRVGSASGVDVRPGDLGLLVQAFWIYVLHPRQVCAKEELRGGVVDARLSRRQDRGD